MQADVFHGCLKCSSAPTSAPLAVVFFRLDPQESGGIADLTFTWVGRLIGRIRPQLLVGQADLIWLLHLTNNIPVMFLSELAELEAAPKIVYLDNVYVTHNFGDDDNLTRAKWLCGN